MDEIKYEAFIELNLQLVDHFYKNFRSLKWQDFNLLAVDGTTAQLPRFEAIEDHLGARLPSHGGTCPHYPKCLYIGITCS